MNTSADAYLSAVAAGQMPPVAGPLTDHTAAWSPVRRAGQTHTPPADCGGQHPAARWPLSAILLCLAFLSGSLCADTAAAAVAPAAAPAQEEIRLGVTVSPERITRVNCKVAIRGQIIAPTTTGSTEMKLSSDAAFTFDQRQFASQVSGAFGLRGWRRFQDAGVTTTVGEDHKTTVQLPASHRLLQVYGTDAGLLHLSPEVRLTRQQVDLLQLPCDPLAAAGLLPSRALTARDEKWNTDTWVTPLLVGLDAVAKQNTACELIELTDAQAVVRFTATADGAVTGAASSISLTGQLTLDRSAGLITQLQARLQEKRSPGTVSPGLDVTADVQWTQTLQTASSDLPVDLAEQLPADNQLQLTLVTPWRLLLLHSREWHLFHETAELVMLRMLRNGSLLGQCNLSPALTMPAGEFTPDDQFRSEVLSALASRQATLVSSRVTPDLNGWRIHHVRASSTASDKTIYWDYHLCTQKSGEQFLVIFSHTQQDDAAFGDAAEQILKTLTLRPVRPRIPLPR